MPELTKEQEIKLGNFKEQLASIRGNIRDANSKLEVILKQREEESRSFEGNLNRHTEIIRGLRKEELSERERIERERLNLNTEILELNENKKTFEEYKNAEYSILQKTREDIGILTQEAKL